MRIVIAPDSFKGSLTAADAARRMASGVLRAIPNATNIQIPMADGGEGTVEAFLCGVGGDLHEAKVTGPLGERVHAHYGILKDGTTAVIETAAASGLPLVPASRRNPLITTSRGTGELIVHAVKQGCKRVIVGLGGSATNDGGMGLAQALGIRFLDRSGRELGDGGGSLRYLDRIDLSGMDASLLEGVQFEAACDVTNPLCGPVGATRVYGPQKGADAQMLEQLESGMTHYAACLLEATGKSFADLPGAGAAGGLGAGLMAFLNARLVPGFQLIAEAAGLRLAIQSADLVLTGEGKTDEQTRYGKVPAGIAAIAREYDVPVVCLSGAITPDSDALYHEGITALFSIVPGPMELEQAFEDAGALAERAAENISRLFAIAAGRKR